MFLAVRPWYAGRSQGEGKVGRGVRPGVRGTKGRDQILGGQAGRQAGQARHVRGDTTWLPSSGRAGA